MSAGKDVPSDVFAGQAHDIVVGAFDVVDEPRFVLDPISASLVERLVFFRRIYKSVAGEPA